MKNIDYNLIYRYLAGETSHAENARIEKWENASSENRSFMAEFEQILHNAVPKNPPATPDVEQAWLEIAEKLGKTTGEARVLPSRMQRKPHHASSKSLRIVAAAAFFIILVGAALFYKNFLHQVDWHQVHTKNAQRLPLRLPDGSNVRLNADSRLQYPPMFSDSVRIVYLSGEAFFEIEPQAKPFLVKTENAQIRVLGTKFNIWARDEQTRVIVKDGRVSLKTLTMPDDSGIVLSGSQMSICRKDSAPETPSLVDSKKLLGWLENRIVFEQTSLSEIIDELQRFYDVRIQLVNPTLGQNTLTGSFHNKPLETVLASICLTLNLQYGSENGKYVILK